MEGCIFCVLAETLNEKQLIFESDHVIAFLDIDAPVVGTSVVLPKKHYMSHLDMPANEYKELYAAVHNVSRNVKIVFECSDVEVTQENGCETPSGTLHTHIRIVPVSIKKAA